ncbi:hypothetical protein Theco_1268 [Thermobacillus composti KWC4]|uniref:Apiosidase-like catalytic domain-containing protein n=2 Tax=Thermobacillus TaxID=76632 RepID=L0ECU1_THECK|nr:hypothetical protein Theco_1268 [Thermobacillus composti KWC4]
MQRLRIGNGGRHLALEDGRPFFWLGDTAWELFHRLTIEDAEHYLRTRSGQQFTVIQAVVLAEFEGVTTANAYGRLPLKTGANGLPDPGQPDTDGPNSYWDHVDAIIRLAESLDLYIALLPTWGDKFNKAWGKGPEIFTPDNAWRYGRWLGERYRDAPNIVWVLGGDSSSRQLHDEPWLDFNMIQSGHGEAIISSDARVLVDYGREPVKPVLDAEPCYEDHPIGFKAANGYFDAADVRKAAYYALLSGACGHTYGHHSVWAMADGPMAGAGSHGNPGNYIVMSWRDALRRPGAEQMRWLRAFGERYAPAGFTPDADVLAGNFEGYNRQVAARGDGCSVVYTPSGPYVDVAADLKGLNAAGARIGCSSYRKVDAGCSLPNRIRCRGER